jgi:TP901 family phage tail tape measure protein
MADVNANIGVNIDTSAALAQLKALQRQISQFHTSIAKSSETAGLAQRDLQKNFLNSVNSIGAFSAELRTVKTTAESFTDSLQKNKFSMREYFRFAGGSTKTFGKLFKSEFDTIGKVADDRVKRLQTQYIKLGRDTSGVMKAIAIMPNQLDMSNFSTQSQLAAQKQAIFNQLVKQGSTNLLNFGKNTQWAGRQLMVGFTLPLATLGTVATRTFLSMETAAINFRKVYGDLFTPEAEREQALQDITRLGEMFTMYGIAVSDTVALSATAAAAGFAGLDLQRQTTEATRLSVLGQIDSQKALTTTIALQNAFKISSEDMANSINFLNAVENQTVLSLDDITEAIPRVGPIIEQLGGDVKDLAFFLTAMKEGGVNAAQGANALKSGLASLIGPSDKAAAALMSYGININKIVESNQGNLRQTVIDFASALDTLDPLNRARAIEQLFGKFQFARISALFSNITTEGTQASRVLDLAGASLEELAGIAESELAVVSDATGTKFKKAMEDLKLALVPIGEAFLQAVTPIVEFIGGILERFNNLSDGVKKAIVVLTVAIGAIGPIALMTFGLLANGIANIIKGALVLRNGYLRLTGQTQILGEQTEYLTMEQIDAAAASHSLDQSHARLTQTFTAESSAVAQLIAAYQQATAAAAKFAAINPGMMRVPGAPTKRAKGKPVVVGGSGNQDTELALLTPGETVIPADMSKQYGALINGMIAGNIPGYQQGRGIKGFKNATIYLQEQINTAMGGSGRGASMSDVLGSLKQSGGAAAAPLLAVIANDIKKGLNNPNNYKEYSTIGDTLINAAINALETSGKEFVKDIDLEQIVVPAMKDAAAGLSVAGVEIKDALERAIEQIRTVAPIGVASGAAGGQGRTNLPGSYRATGKTAQEFAMKKNADVFARQTVQSQSRGTKQVFKMRDVDSQKYVTATMAHIMPSINASVSEIESKISAYVPQAAKRLEKIGEQAGKKIGKSTVDGVAIGAKTASPSKDTIKTGQDIGRGLEIGMDSMQDDVAVSGQELGSAAVGGTQSGARQRRSASRPQGAPGSIGLSGAVNSAVSPAIKSAIDTEVKARKTSAARIDSMNRGLMAGTFALTSLAGAGSMAGGTIGNLSQHVMKFSGLLFALMSVTQLLTQAKFAQLIATRATTVATAMGGTGFKSLFSRGGGLAGFGKNLLTAGKFLLRFAGPIGLVTTGLIGLYSITKMINAQREKERQRLEAFSDVITVSTDKLKFLSEQFNFVPVKGSLENFGKDLERTSVTVRNAREELKASEGFQETYGQDIEQVRGMSNQQAETALSFMGLDLISQGMAKEQVQLLIDAIKEEAGKKDLKFDFKSITFDEKGMSGLNSQFDVSIKEFADTAQKGFEKVFQQVAVGEGRSARIQIVERLVPNAEAKAAIKNAGKLIGSYAESLNRLATSGQIGMEDLTKITDNMFASIAESAPDASMQIRIFNATLNSIDPVLAKSVKGVKDLKNMHLLLKAAIAGVSTNLIASAALAFKTAEALNKVAAANLKAFGVQDLTADQARARGDADSRAVDFRILLNKEMEKELKLAKELNKVVGDGTGKGTGEDSPFVLAIKQLQNQQKELINTEKAYEILTEAGFDAATATRYAEDSVIALGLATGKISTTQLNKVKVLMEDIEKRAGSEAITRFLDSLGTENKLKEGFFELVPQVMALGGTLKDVEAILNNPTLMQSFLDSFASAETKTERIKKTLNAFRTGEAIDIKFDLLLDPGKAAEELKRKADELFGFLERAAQREYKPKIINAEKEVKNAQEAVDKIQDKIDAIQTKIDLEQRTLETTIGRKIEDYQEQVSDLQREIETQFDRPIQAIQNEISALERGIELDFDRPISALQETSSDLSNDLALMDKEAESINERYDAQAKALEDVANINQRILGQQKQQISLADALTQGDISAAAQMAQESRASEAEASSANAQNTLQAARQLELDRLRNAAGLTRKQIEEAQFVISQQVFALEEQREAVQARIQIKQDQIFAIEQARKIKLDEIKLIEDSIYLLEEQREAAMLIIRGYEDDIYNIKINQLDPATNALEIAQASLQTLRDELQARLDNIELQRDAWQAAADAEMAAKVTAGEYNDVILKTIEYLNGVLSLWQQIAAAAAAANAKTLVATGGGFVPDPNASPAANQEGADAAAAAADAVAESNSAADEATAAALAAADAVTALSVEADKIIASIETTKSNLSPKAKAILKEEENRKIALEKQALQNAAKAAGLAARYGGTVGTEAEKIIEEIFTPGRGATSALGMQAMSSGGMVKPKYFSVGGPARGTDTIPAMLTPGEFVMSKYAVSNYGVDKMKAMNTGTYEGEKVYNYNLSVNVKSDANPDDIARVVMTQIKQIDSQRVRGQRA